MYGRDGKIETTKGGKAYLRSDWQGHRPPECRTSRGCPKGTPEKPIALNENNRLCYAHYLECRAVGSFPDDPIVRENAAIIREVEDEYYREQDKKLHTDIRDMFGMMLGLKADE